MLEDTHLFRTIYFINLLLGSIVTLDVVSGIMDGFLMIWAIFIFKNNLTKNKNILKIKHSKILLCFIASAILTALIQLRVSFPINFGFDLIMIFHFAVCFFIFYGMHIENKEKIYGEMIKLFKYIVFLTTILTFISFIVVLFKNKIVIEGSTQTFGNFKYVIGMYETAGIERFTGLYINPNILAFCSVVSIIFCTMLAREKEFLKEQKRWIQITTFFVCILINLAALILSDSIASFLLMIIYIIFLMFYRLVVSNKSRLFKKSKFASLIVFIILGISLILGSIGIRYSFQNEASDFINDVYSIVSGNDEAINGQNDIIFGRGHYDLEGGNGRRRLLKQASIIFKHNPVMGIGIANIKKYGQMYFDSGIAFPNFHNGYVTILVCYGAIGFLFFMSFFLILLFQFFRFLFNNRISQNIFPNLLSAILAYSVFSLFEKTIISEINFMGVFFWLMLGYASTYLFNENSKSKTIKSI
ncbi:MAG: hypothetical protein RUMPE_00752 [Eubacteriales bacterium SKADARSKE-1]|nr:hypothetical protein [Eubacteriales bacterium SKADARSKE-1]